MAQETTEITFKVTLKPTPYILKWYEDDKQAMHNYLANILRENMIVQFEGIGEVDEVKVEFLSETEG